MNWETLEVEHNNGSPMDFLQALEMALIERCILYIAVAGQRLQAAGIKIRRKEDDVFRDWLIKVASCNRQLYLPIRGHAVASVSCFRPAQMIPNFTISGPLGLFRKNGFCLTLNGSHTDDTVCHKHAWIIPIVFKWDYFFVLQPSSVK